MLIQSIFRKTAEPYVSGSSISFSGLSLINSFAAREAAQFDSEQLKSWMKMYPPGVTLG